MRKVPRLTSLLASIPGIAASGSPIQALDVDKRYHSLRLYFYSAGTLTDPTTTNIDNIKVFVNGVTMIDASPANLIKLAKLKGITPATGEIPVYFSDPSAFAKQNPQIAEMTSFDLFGQKSFAVQVTVNAAVAATPSVDVVTEFDYLRNQRLNRKTGKIESFLSVMRVKQLTLAALASGDNDVTTIPVDAAIHKLCFTVSANAISKIQLEADSAKILDMTKAQNSAMLNAHGFAASNFEYPIVFDYDRKLSSELVCGSMKAKITTTGALTPTVIAEYRLNAYK